MRLPKSRTSVIVDWHARRTEDLPDIAPGEECEHVIAPQKFAVLRQILVRDLHLIYLQIGAVEGVLFELENTDGPRRTYRPSGLEDEALKKRLIKVGAAVAAPHEIALAPGLEVRMRVRNEGGTTAKLRVALLVREEIT